jgi:hypothetical protein
LRKYTTDKGTIMNGAESLVGTLVASGIEVCFAVLVQI